MNVKLAAYFHFLQTQYVSVLQLLSRPSASHSGKQIWRVQTRFPTNWLTIALDFRTVDTPAMATCIWILMCESIPNPNIPPGQVPGHLSQFLKKRSNSRPWKQLCWSNAPLQFLRWWSNARPPCTSLWRYIEYRQWNNARYFNKQNRSEIGYFKNDSKQNRFLHGNAISTILKDLLYLFCKRLSYDELGLPDTCLDGLRSPFLLPASIAQGLGTRLCVKCQPCRAIWALMPGVRPGWGVGEGVGCSHLEFNPHHSFMLRTLVLHWCRLVRCVRHSPTNFTDFQESRIFKRLELGLACFSPSTVKSQSRNLLFEKYTYFKVLL